MRRRGAICCRGSGCCRTPRTGSGSTAGFPATHIRLNIYPDGGVARLRLHGSLTDDGLAAVRQRWDETA